jgi:MFS family permease
MLSLELFRSHNFSVVNSATLFVYAGLLGAFFFITLFLQQVADYTPFQAGAATTPVTVIMFVLSGRFGAFASRIGPRLPMGIGPIIGAVGLALLLGLDRDPSYLVDVLPAMLLFGLGLAMTVAPLTTTVLDSVEERHAGIASGVNNAVARVAGLLAIAALGAVISAQFASSLDERVAGTETGTEAQAAIDDAKAQPLTGGDVSDVPEAEAAALDDDMVSASESAFHLGMAIAAGLMAVGGLISLLGVRNPERPTEPERHHVPAAAAAGECGRSDGPERRPSPVPGTLAPEPAAASGGSDPLP